MLLYCGVVLCKTQFFPSESNLIRWYKVVTSWVTRIGAVNLLGSTSFKVPITYHLCDFLKLYNVNQSSIYLIRNCTFSFMHTAALSCELQLPYRVSSVNLVQTMCLAAHSGNVQSKSLWTSLPLVCLQSVSEMSTLHFSGLQTNWKSEYWLKAGNINPEPHTCLFN